MDSLRSETNRPDIRVAVIGECRIERDTHAAVAEAVHHAVASLGATAEVTWVPTREVEAGAKEVLGSYDGVWIAPGAPYESFQGAINAIEFARTTDVPLLGCCGGFQHVIIEFALHVVGIEDAARGLYDPTQEDALIAPLTCSVAGQVGEVLVQPGTIAHAAYRAGSVRENFRCSYGINPDHAGKLVDAGLVISGTDPDAGPPRIVELPGQRFYVATLFVPQLASAPEAPNPIVKAYVAAVLEKASAPAATS
jgi:CTP synthase (UTP-ammonia lyase)